MEEDVINYKLVFDVPEFHIEYLRPHCIESTDRIVIERALAFDFSGVTEADVSEVAGAEKLEVVFPGIYTDAETGEVTGRVERAMWTYYEFCMEAESNCQIRLYAEDKAHVLLQLNSIKNGRCDEIEEYY